MQDFCLGELAIARQCGATALRNALADVLDLTHRLPRVWAVVQALACDVWVARRVASLSRDLPLARVGQVDAAVAAAIGSESAGRVLDLAAGAIVAADPDAHAEKVAAEARRRFVGFSRIDEHGLCHVIARVTAGDAAWIKATLSRAVDLRRGCGRALLHRVRLPGQAGRPARPPARGLRELM